MYDAYDAISTLADDNASILEKGLTVAGLGIGLVAPGGGYGTGARALGNVVEEAIEHGDEVVDAVRAAQAATLKQNKVAGASAEEYLLKEYGGEAQVSLKTSQGQRYVDNVVEGHAREAKVGRQSANKRTVAQVLKDAEIVKDNLGNIRQYTWEFFKSGATKKSGPSKALRRLLDQNGIGINENNITF